MRPSITPAHAAVLVATGIVAAQLLSACGSSSSTATAPAVLPRCGVTLSPTDGTAPPQGSSGHLTIKTERECAWTAASEASWLSIRGPANGQGDGSIEYTVAANPDPASRRATIAVNDQRAAVSQAAAECTISLNPSSASVPLTGGSGSVQVQASSALCTWTATSDVEWISITSGASGTGNATVVFEVVATSGPARAGTLLVGGQRFSVTQSQGCTYGVAPTTHAASPIGGHGSLTVTTAPGCPWTAASNESWITITGSTSGSGPASVTFAVESTNGPARAGTLLVAGQSITITQAAACSFSVAPATFTFGGTGGSASVAVNAPAGCSWTASSNVPWISISGQTSGAGNGSVTIAVAASTGSSRTGTLTIAGQTVTVTQADGCAYAIAPESQSAAASGAPGSVSVTTSAGCSWTATSNASWITITSGATGTGSGTAQFSIGASTVQRSGTLTIAGRTFTVNQQGPPCTIAITPDRADVAAAGGTGAIAVAAGAGCAWTAAANVPWISLTSGVSGTGNGTVVFSVAANSADGRTGTMTIGDQTFTISQAPGCAITIAPTTADIAVGGGTGSVTVTAASGCVWTASAAVPWVTITAGTSGTGNGTVAFSVAANTGPARTGVLTIAGQTFTINQARACTVSISPPSSSLPATGGTGTIAITAADGCAWSATTAAPWIAIGSGASGVGNATVIFTAGANTGGARSDVISVAGQSHLVTQAAAVTCTYSLAPVDQAVPAGGGTGTLTVSAPAGCVWTAATDATWVTMTSGATGAGDGTIAFAAAANAGAARTATVIVMNQTATIQQTGGCGFSISPTAENVPAPGGNGTVAVTTAASCAWTASSQAAWLTILSGASGTGPGTVVYAAAANTGPARTGTLTIAGLPFSVHQASGCTYAINPTHIAVRKQGERVEIAVTAAAGCAWTATSPVPWIRVASGAEAAGDGTVVLEVERNQENPRTASVIIAGLTLTVTQEN